MTGLDLRVERTTDQEDHQGHRFHWDAAGSGDTHCSEHPEDGCTCIVWAAGDEE